MPMRLREVVAVAALLVSPACVRGDEILVSAASSLTDAMTEVGRAFSAQNSGVTVRFNFGASGALKQQIERGAPVDVFASASPVEMDGLERARRIEPGTRITFAGNRLVLIAPVRFRIARWNDLASPNVRRIAIGNPDSVPSGRYARDALIH